MSRGLFIAFEGGEGAGKSTQVHRLAEVLRVRYGRQVVVTREPGGSWLGGQLRPLVLRGGMCDRAEVLLYLADRAEHVDTVIRPALAAGQVVICDRFAGSSVAYQGFARQLGEQWVQQMSLWAAGGLAPDLTVLLDLDPAVGLARARARGEVDRMEDEDLPFHWNVRASFLRQAMVGRKSWAAVRADQAEDVVAELVETVVIQRLGLAGTGWVERRAAV